MRRTTITLPDDLHHQLDLEAKRLGVPITEVVREALRDRLLSPERPLSLIGVGGSGRGDVSERFDQLRDRSRPKHLLTDGSTTASKREP